MVRNTRPVNDSRQSEKSTNITKALAPTIRFPSSLPRKNCERMCVCVCVYLVNLDQHRSSVRLLPSTPPQPVRPARPPFRFGGAGPTLLQICARAYAQLSPQGVCAW